MPRCSTCGRDWVVGTTKCADDGTALERTTQDVEIMGIVDKTTRVDDPPYALDPGTIFRNGPESQHGRTTVPGEPAAPFQAQPVTEPPMALDRTRLASDYEDIADYLPEGTRLGDYIIEYKVGAGGMAAVYAARQPDLDQRFAVKILRTALANDQDMIARFKREATVLGRIRHPNVVSVFTFSEYEDGRPYFVMEWLAGESLGERLEQGARPLPEALNILFQIASAIEAVHSQGMVHRDLKPGNVMLTKSAQGTDHVKLVDFGIVRLLDNSWDDGVHTRVGTVMGTPSYIPPEQAKGEKTDPRGDIYALGVIAYELVTGKRPYVFTNLHDAMRERERPPPPPSEHRPGLPRRLDRLLLAMLSGTRRRRPKLGEILDTFEALGAEHNLERARIHSAAEVHMPPRKKKNAQRWRSLLVGLLAVAILVAVALVLS